MTDEAANERARRARANRRAIEGLDQYERPRLDVSWMLQAACRGTDPEMWYPARGDSAGSRAAKAVCNECEVRFECLEHALAADEDLGTRGGLSERQRRNIREARARRARKAS